MPLTSTSRRSLKKATFNINKNQTLMTISLISATLIAHIVLITILATDLIIMFSSETASSVLAWLLLAPSLD